MQPFGPVFSIVVPALNEALILPRCLASLAEQAVEGGAEVLVIDNGSSDGTAEVARGHGARVISCPHKGVVFARQAGLEAATGLVVVHLDADSQLGPNVLQLLGRRFADPSIVAVIGDVHYVPGSMGTRAMERIYRATNSFLNRLFRRPMFALAGALAIRRSALLAADGYDVGQPHTGDEAGLLARLHHHGKLVWEPRFVVESSDRRFRGRFAQWLMTDLFIHSFLDQIIYRITRRSRWGGRSVIR